jgi:hypothetical protein
VLEAVRVEDPAPLARPPRLPDVPRPPRSARGLHAAGLLASAGAIALGLAAIRQARRP